MKKFKLLVKERWYVQGINAVPAFIHAGPVTAIFGMKKSLGFNHSKFIMIYRDDYCDLYYNRADLHNVADNIVKRYKKDKDYTKFLWNQSKEEGKPMLNHIKTKLSKINELSDDRLLKGYVEFSKLFYGAFDTSHAIEGFALTTDVLVKDLLLKDLQKKKLEKEFTTYFTLLSQPTKRSFNMDINNMLHKMLELIRQDNKLLKMFNDSSVDEIIVEGELKKLVGRFVKDFSWIKATWAGGKELDVDGLVNDLKEHIKMNDDIPFIDENVLKENVENKKRLYKELELSDELKMYLDLTEFVTYWQDDRKILVLKGCVAMEKYVMEIARRKNTKSENLKYLLPDEVLDGVDEKMLAERRKKSAFVYVNKDRSILIGKDFDEFIKMLDKQKQDDDMKEINGMCASIGKVVGKVNVCKNVKNIEKVEEGCVLVTTMTRPEFLPAMKKSVAVVTDEGGLTCHAAIVSRELGIPCIIGTKIATKVLKTGDLVEVNANHGVVRVMK